MNKPLHKRLRELKWATANEIREREEVIHSDELIDKWADEIENRYILLPCDLDGDLWDIGDDSNYGRLEALVYNGRWFGRVNSCTFPIENLERPTPKVLDADGVPCKSNDEVWSTNKEGVYEEGDMMIVVGIDAGVKEKQVLVRRALGGAGEQWVTAKYLTHEKPVFDADGKRIKVGDTVYNLENDGEQGTVRCFYSYGVGVEWSSGWRSDGVNPQYLTHEKPVFDAEGVRICKGDTVWHVGDSSRGTVIGVIIDNTWHGYPVKVAWDKGDEGFYQGDVLTHQEPDSYEKLLDDMRGYADGGVSCIEDDMHMFADRLTALIERGA